MRPPRAIAAVMGQARVTHLHGGARAGAENGRGHGWIEVAACVARCGPQVPGYLGIPGGMPNVQVVGHPAAVTPSGRRRRVRPRGRPKSSRRADKALCSNRPPSPTRTSWRSTTPPAKWTRQSCNLATILVRVGIAYLDGRSFAVPPSGPDEHRETMVDQLLRATCTVRGRWSSGCFRRRSWPSIRVEEHGRRSAQ